MLAAPESDKPLFGLVMNGSNFVFLKLVKGNGPQYAKSKELILDQDDGLATTLQVMKRLGEIVNVTIR